LPRAAKTALASKAFSVGAAFFSWQDDAMGSIDYWTQLGVSQFWAALIVAVISAFGLGMWLMGLINRGQINAISAQKTLAEDRLKQAMRQCQ
jgi:hypothetical protein